MEKSPAQELCDILNALTIQIKYMETLIDEHKKNSRTDQDFCIRFSGQSHLLAKTLTHIKPNVELLVKEGYNRIDACTKRSDTEEQVQSGQSEGVDTATPVQD